MSSAGAAAIVPVRVGSQRLPGKALLADSGRPLFLHTWARAAEATCFTGAGVWVATDDEEVAAAAEAAGAPVLRTSAHPRTGSERCAEAAVELPANVEIVVNVQGDWPEVAPGDLDRLVVALRRSDLPSATLAAPLTDDERIRDPNVVKVVRARDGRALYFSRSAIPFVRDGAPEHQHTHQQAQPPAAPPTHGYPTLRHIGVYAYRRDLLARLPALDSSGLAECESLEQLKQLEHGIPMLVLDASNDPWGIETRSDYDRFLERLNMRTDGRDS